MTIVGRAVKTWSSTQSMVATSSGDAEYYALARGAAEAFGVVAIRDFGWELMIHLWVGSSKAKAVAGHMGKGRTRRLLWLQEIVAQRHFDICKRRGDLNPGV